MSLDDLSLPVNFHGNLASAHSDEELLTLLQRAKISERPGPARSKSLGPQPNKPEEPSCLLYLPRAGTPDGPPGRNLAPKPPNSSSAHGRERKTLVVTNQPYFYKKAELFPDSTFVVGVDTAIRLLDPKYYGHSKARMLEVMEGIKQLGCDFLVAGRVVDGVFTVLSDIQVPTQVQSMFQEIAESVFQSDLSSTQLRQTRQN